MAQRMKTLHSRSRLRRGGPFGGCVAALAEHRHLMYALAVREMRDRYAGSLLGLLWAILQPVAFIATLIIVFDFAFAARLGKGTGGVQSDYAALVIAGFLPWMAISNGMQSAVGCIRINAGLVKQIDFPLEVLPAKVALAQIAGQLVGLGLLVTYLAFSHGDLPKTLPLVVPALLLQIVLMFGLGFILATLGAYFRDLEHALPTLLMINLYLMPIFYPRNAVPEPIRALVDWNPFTPVVRLFQDILIHGETGTPAAWAVTALLAAASLDLGYRLFRRASAGFGDLV